MPAPRLSRRLSAEPLEARDVPAAVGALDPSFGSAGTAVYDTGVSERFNAVGLQPDGKIVAAGAWIPGATSDFLVVRYNPDGTPDPTFNANAGRFTLDLGGGDTALDLAVQPDGKIVVVGTGGAGADFQAIRLNADGTLDGIAAPIDFGGTDVARGVAVQSDGKIVIAGDTSAGGADGEIVRLNPNLTRDTTFNNNTGVRDILAGGTEFLWDVAVYPALAPDVDGIVVVGSTTTGGGGRDVLVRVLNPDGTNDPDFAGENAFGGTGRYDVAGSDVGFGVAIDEADGGIVVAGTGSSGGFVLRLTGTGTRVTTGGFAGGAKLLPTLGATDVVVDPLGRIVVVGSDTAAGAAGVTRLNPDGTADASFNGGTPLLIGTGLSAFAAAVTLQPNGRVVLAGSAANASDGALARVIGSVERPAVLSVGGTATGTAKRFAPTTPAGTYTPDAVPATPAGVFGGFAGDVRTATGDVNGDGFADTVMVTGPGTKTVMAVVSGKDGSVLVPATDPFGDANFTFGGYVTAGDIDGDGRAEWVVTPELRGGPRVIIFRLLPDNTFDITSGSQPSIVANFFGIGDPSFRDGDRPALGDVNGDGVLDVFSIAAFNGGPRTAIFDGKDVLVARAQGRNPNKLVNDFFAAASGQDEGRGGRSIAVGDVNGDGLADLIATGDNLLGTGNRVTVFSGADLLAGRFPGLGATPLADFTVSNFSGSSLASVATADADGDNRAEVVVGSGAGQPSAVKVYLGKDVSGTAEPAATTFDPFGAATVGGVFVG